MAEKKVITTGTGKDTDTGEKINFGDKTTVYATDKGKFYAVGEPVELHPKQAEDWIKRGLATKEKAVVQAETTTAASKTSDQPKP